MYITHINITSITQEKCEKISIFKQKNENIVRKKLILLLYNINNMLPVPIIIVISIGSIIVTGIIIESIYVSICNVIRKYKNNKHSRKYKGEITTPNPIIEI